MERIDGRGNLIERRDYAGSFVFEGERLSEVLTEEGRLIPWRKVKPDFFVRDHLGSVRAVVSGDGRVLEANSYYPYGMKIDALSSTNYTSSDVPNRYKYNGKELFEDLQWLKYGARFYDAVVGRFWGRDPMAEKGYGWSSYRYGFDNPVSVIDPDGRLEGDYIIDKNGTFHLVRKTDDPYDRILKTDRNGNIKYKGQGLFGFLVPKSQRGEPKILLDRIAKGILYDGINFKNQDQIIYVNGPGQPKLNEVEQFLVDMTDYIVHVEIAGAYLSRDKAKIEAVYVGKYKNNGLTYSYFTPNYGLLQKYSFTLKDLYVHFHTHPSGVYSTEDQIRPSRKDLEYRDNQRKNFEKFIILTNHPASPIDYTNW